MKDHIKTPEKELSNKEIANLSHAEFKTLVIRMLTEMVEYGCKIDDEVKAMQSEIKKNIQKTNKEGKETRTQINGVDQKEERNIHPEQNEETRPQKNEERLRNLQDNFEHSNIQIIEVPGEEKEQQIENLFEKNNEIKLPQTGKGSRHTSPGTQGVPKKLDPKRNTPRHIIT